MTDRSMTRPGAGAAEVARGLGPGERAGMTGRILHINGRTRDRLVDKGILMPGGTNWSPLGLAVRRAIQEQTND